MSDETFVPAWAAAIASDSDDDASVQNADGLTNVVSSFAVAILLVRIDLSTWQHRDRGHTGCNSLAALLRLAKKDASPVFGNATVLDLVTIGVSDNCLKRHSALVADVSSNIFALLQLDGLPCDNHVHSILAPSVEPKLNGYVCCSVSCCPFAGSRTSFQ